MIINVRFYFHRPEDGASQEFRRKLLSHPDAADDNNNNKQAATRPYAPRILIPSTQETMTKWGLVPLMLFLAISWRVWSTKQTFVRKGLHKKHESDHMA
jgi:hypothetical protein